MNEAVKRAGEALRDLYPMGVSLLWKAPLVLALVVVPEFVQHVVEIKLGMFEGGAATRAAADSPLRWAFGFAKIVGLVLAMLASARFWSTHRAGHAWYDPRGIAWRRLILGTILFMGVPSLPLLATGYVSDMATQLVSLAITLPLLPMLFLMVGGLFGDRETPLRDYWRRSWGWTLFTALLVVVAFWPASQLHRLNHVWAMKQPLLLVWPLMAFDSLIVGLLAGMTGTALYLGYAGFARGRAEQAFNLS